MISIERIDPTTVWHPSMNTSLLIHGLLGSPLFGRGIVTVVLLCSQSSHPPVILGVFFPYGVPAGTATTWIAVGKYNSLWDATLSGIAIAWDEE